MISSYSYAVNDIKEMLRDMARWDDFAKRCHLKAKVRSKRFQTTKWYSVIYK